MSRWDIRIEQIRKERGLAGLSVALTNRERVVYARGFGCESVERPQVACTAHSLYRVASITKVITCLTVMRAVERGQLSLDRPIVDDLPALALSDPDATARLTLRHLLSHTAGLPAEYTPDGPREESALAQSLYSALPTLPLGGLPGEADFLYSNWGFRLAALVLEAVTGEPYSTLARRDVLVPLGMRESTFDIREAITYPVALPHERDGAGELRVLHYMKENAARLSAGGLYSNVTDLCALARLLLNAGKNDAGERVVTPESLAEMMTPHAKMGEGDQYGLALRIHPFEGHTLIGHLGSAPPYAGALWVDPASGFGLVVEMNTEDKALRVELPELLFADIFAGTGDF